MLIQDASYSAHEFEVQGNASQRLVKGDSGGGIFVIVDGIRYLAGLDSMGASDLERDGSSKHEFSDIVSFLPGYMQWIQAEMERLRASGISRGPGWSCVVQPSG